MSARSGSLLWAYVPELHTLSGRDPLGRVTLDADESRHVVVRRLRVGDEMVLFDGAGRTATAEVEAMHKKSVDVRVNALEFETDSLAESGQQTSECLLATAIPKGDRLSTMLQMITQLGVRAWQPLVLEESAMRELDPDAKRLRRILVESAKVARRPWLLSVKRPVSLAAVLDEYSLADSGSIYYGDREGESDGLASGARLLLIGPEAGFSDSEKDLVIRAGALPCAFSPHNLRIEVAAVGAAVALNLAAARGEAGARE